MKATSIQKIIDCVQHTPNKCVVQHIDDTDHNYYDKNVVTIEVVHHTDRKQLYDELWVPPFYNGGVPVERCTLRFRCNNFCFEKVGILLQGGSIVLPQPDIWPSDNHSRPFYGFSSFYRSICRILNGESFNDTAYYPFKNFDIPPALSLDADFILSGARVPPTPQPPKPVNNDEDDDLSLEELANLQPIYSFLGEW